MNVFWIVLIGISWSITVLIFVFWLIMSYKPEVKFMDVGGMKIPMFSALSPLQERVQNLRPFLRPSGILYGVSVLIMFIVIMILMPPSKPQRTGSKFLVAMSQSASGRFILELSGSFFITVILGLFSAGIVAFIISRIIIRIDNLISRKK